MAAGDRTIRGNGKASEKHRHHQWERIVSRLCGQFKERIACGHFQTEQCADHCGTFLLNFEQIIKFLPVTNPSNQLLDIG
ncbi:hypothetical protein TNCV_2761461 [Trichonephila clavipes]|nr:hypothetical protein TNCV_2761461 [Trichonephila clavipes]